VIYVEQSVGLAIALFKQGTQKERPLTHDLLANILGAPRSEDRKRNRHRECDGYH
jgi:bifunctional DNase/RNase